MVFFLHLLLSSHRYKTVYNPQVEGCDRLFAVSRRLSHVRVRLQNGGRILLALGRALPALRCKLFHTEENREEVAEKLHSLGCA